MRKLFRIIIVLLLSMLCINPLGAKDNHIIVDEYSDYISQEQVALLEEDLDHIENDYDISVYFVVNFDIGVSADELIYYGKTFAESNFVSKNNVGLFLNSDYYYILCNGPDTISVEDNKDELWKILSPYLSSMKSPEDENLYKGIEAFYQKCVSLINATAYNNEVPTVINTPFVNDFADVLSDEQEAKLNTRLMNFKNNYGLDAVVVITDSTNGMSIQDYADDFYDYNDYSDDGIEFVICLSDRSWYVSTKGKAIEYYTDYGIDVIFDEMRHELSSGNYYDAFVTFSKVIGELAESAKQGKPVDVPEPEPATFGLGNILIAAAIGGIASLITMLILKAQLKSVKPQYYAGNYIVPNSFLLTGASDLFVNRSVSRTRKPTNEGSSGGSSGGGSSVHTSSSGSSHGGHGGHF